MNLQWYITTIDTPQLKECEVLKNENDEIFAILKRTCSFQFRYMIYISSFGECDRTAHFISEETFSCREEAKIATQRILHEKSAWTKEKMIEVISALHKVS